MILSALGETLDVVPAGGFEIVRAWPDGFSVQVRCLSAYGEAVDMSSAEARKFAQLLIACADKAERGHTD